MTQAELAERAGVTEQTIRKIEHGSGNPQLEVFSSLIVSLKIDPVEIFYPTPGTDNSARKQLDIIIAGCQDDQIRDLLPVVEAALAIIRGQGIIVAK